MFDLQVSNSKSDYFGRSSTDPIKSLHIVGS